MLTIQRKLSRHGGFSLVEMLVVIAIIALLVAALLPAFGAVRYKAKMTATLATFNGLGTGIATYRAEQELGGAMPPSSSDKPTTDNGQQSGRNLIKNPKKRSGGPDEIRIAGAHLLVYAMIGADGLGAAGFRDVTPQRNGTWWDDMHDELGGLYHVYDAGSNVGKTQFQRYGGGGYVDEKMREKITSLQEMYDEGKIPTDPSTLPPDTAVKEPMFLDAWGFPILYYRSNPSSIFMTGSGSRDPKAGIYWQEDNAVLTGSEDGALGQVQGVDFGAGRDDHGELHWIHSAKSPGTAQSEYDDLAKAEEDGTPYHHTFAAFIWDPSVKARPTPVQKNEYLLISAGADGIYGSDDDVTNWTRNTE